MRFQPHHKTAAIRTVALAALVLLQAAELSATTTTTTTVTGGTGPWVDAVTVLQNAFTGTIARGLSLIAIVIGGLMFAFGEGGSKRALAGIVFGLGMTLGAANFIDWLF